MNLTDINEIKELLARHGFRFSKSLGQNFLINASIPEQIAEASQTDGSFGVIEVGPGIGCLTEQLAKRAGRVVAIEMDRKLAPVLKETLSGNDNIEIIYGDALKQNLKALAEEKLPGLRKAVCANLPYNVTSPLITAFIEAGCFESITVMIQREVARRICSGPDCADYGAFGIFVQWHCEPELLFDVPPSCFIPQPKVTSSVIRLKMREKPPVEVSDEQLMFRIIRAAFNQRRKTFVNAVSSAVAEANRETVTAALENCGYSPVIRGEVLDIGGFAKITDEIKRINAMNLS